MLVHVHDPLWPEALDYFAEIRARRNGVLRSDPAGVALNSGERGPEALDLFAEMRTRRVGGVRADPVGVLSTGDAMLVGLNGGERGPEAFDFAETIAMSRRKGVVRVDKGAQARGADDGRVARAAGYPRRCGSCTST